MSVDNDTADDDALPHNQSDIVNGVGPIDRIISLAAYAGDDDNSRIWDGRCNSCGYDRGRYQSHTEIAQFKLTCMACGVLLDKN